MIDLDLFPSKNEWRDGEPCDHPGCLRHLSHPCEGCGRLAGKRIERVDDKIKRAGYHMKNGVFAVCDSALSLCADAEEAKLIVRAVLMQTYGMPHMVRQECEIATDYIDTRIDP